MLSDHARLKKRRRLRRLFFISKPPKAFNKEIGMCLASLMLAVFTISLTLLSSTGLLEVFGPGVMSRFVALLTWSSGVIALLQRHAPTWIDPEWRADPERIRPKTWSIALGLIALLLYSAGMNQLGIGAFDYFLLDYLVALPLILLALPVYLRWVEPRLHDPEDADWQFGQVLTGRRPWIFAEQKTYLLAWAVKIAFIPIMYGGLMLTLEQLLAFDWRLEPTSLVGGLFLFGLAFDLVIASGGYLFASRLFGNEVRSTDDTFSGWLVCMICYPPLVYFFHLAREQTDNIIWSDWLAPNDPLYWFWAALVTLTWIIYWISNASFGLRFSNLSWRGLIAHGPYRWFKHPSYLAKNIYWWLHTVPFIGVASGLDLARNLAGLTFVALVYWLRAKTEERHLMRFPEYAAYSAWIDEHGLFARLRRWVLRLRHAH